MRKFNIGFVLFMIICIGTICFVDHTDIPSATKVLIHNGYKPISVGGYDWFNGSKSDFYKTKFTAAAQNGDTITGCVTKGYWGKGSTIRLND